VLAAALSSVAGHAAAQERDPAAAQALFDQARELIRQRRFADACPKLQESNRLDPGIGTQFHLADCYEQSGKVASAWAAFLEVVSQARAANQSDREKAAQKRAEKLEPRLPHLIVNVPDASQAAGLEIRRNGMMVGAATWGTPLPVDPGEVELSASAPGKQSARQVLVLDEGKTTTFTLTALLPGPTAEPTTSPPMQPSPPPEPTLAASTASAPRDEPGAKSGGNRVAIISLASVGVIGLGVGTTFALMAKSDDKSSKDNCNPSDPNKCDRSGVEQRNSAITKGNVATVGFIVGGAALASAGVVWLLSGSSEPKQTASGHFLRAVPEVEPGHAMLHVQGSF
jgi:hypothetical protein